MKFSDKEDIEAPIGEVFAILSEFEQFERSVIRRGGDVQRLASFDPPAPGMAWQVGFTFRGKLRDVTVELAEYDADNRICFAGGGSGLKGVLEVELLALAPHRTRLSVALKLEPQTLSARLMVQSMRLAKSKLNQKFKQRVADFAATTEQRLGRAA